MRSFKYRKHRRTKAKKHRVKKYRMRKTKTRRHKTKKTKRMRGGDGTLSKILNINLGPAEATLKGLETDVYSVEHSSTRPIPKAPGMNVGQPYNRPYTGFGWFQ